jgi:hypothetical protein
VYESVDISAKVRDAQLKHLVKTSGLDAGLDATSSSGSGGGGGGKDELELTDFRVAMQDDRGRHDMRQLKLRFMCVVIVVIVLVLVGWWDGAGGIVAVVVPAVLVAVMRWWWCC